MAVKGHGMLLDPPARSSLWRYGFENAPTNYDDNALNCGNYSVNCSFHLNSIEYIVH